MHGFLTYGLSFLIVLGVLIFVHELGHFIAARLFDVRVDVFSFGFGPRLWGRKHGDTDYRLSAFPLGGYVKMAGDNPVEERSGAPYEFLSKPRWQRAVIALAGPTMNFVLAVLLVVGMYKVAGPDVPYRSEPVRVAAVLPGSPAGEAGVRPGDLYIRIGKTQTPTWRTALRETKSVMFGGSLSALVLRDGQQIPVTIHVPPAKILPTSELLGDGIYKVQVEEVSYGAPGDKAGLQVNDEVEEMNGQPLLDSTQALIAIRTSKGNPVTFVVRREGANVPLTVHPTYGDPGDGEKRWYIGVSFGPKPAYVPHPWAESFQEGFSFNLDMSRRVVGVLAGLLTGRVSWRQLGGPVAIAQQSGEAAKQGPLAFLAFMALISVNLGILNLLPIPILDGGHLLLLAIEGTLRRDLSIPVKERFVQVGFVFLLALFCFVMYSDIAKIVHH